MPDWRDTMQQVLAGITMPPAMPPQGSFSALARSMANPLPPVLRSGASLSSAGAQTRQGVPFSPPIDVTATPLNNPLAGPADPRVDDGPGINDPLLYGGNMIFPQIGMGIPIVSGSGTRIQPGGGTPAGETQSGGGGGLLSDILGRIVPGMVGNNSQNTGYTSNGEPLNTLGDLMGSQHQVGDFLGGIGGAMGDIGFNNPFSVVGRGLESPIQLVDPMGNDQLEGWRNLMRQIHGDDWYNLTSNPNESRQA